MRTEFHLRSKTLHDAVFGAFRDLTVASAPDILRLILLLPNDLQITYSLKNTCQVITIRRKRGVCFSKKSFLLFCQNSFLIDIEMFEGDPGSIYHTKKCVFGKGSLYARSSKYKLWKISKLRRTSCHDNTAIDDI